MNQMNQSLKFKSVYDAFQKQHRCFWTMLNHPLQIISFNLKKRISSPLDCVMWVGRLCIASWLHHEDAQLLKCSQENEIIISSPQHPTLTNWSHYSTPPVWLTLAFTVVSHTLQQIMIPRNIGSHMQYNYQFIEFWSENFVTINNVYS